MHLAYTASIQDAGLPYEVVQSEFQGSADDRWFVVQLADPVEALLDAGAVPSGDALLEATITAPLRAYREAARDLRTRLEGKVSTFILSYRDPQQTVFDIPADVMWRYVDGDLDDDAFADAIRITAVNR